MVDNTAAPTIKMLEALPRTVMVMSGRRYGSGSSPLRHDSAKTARYPPRHGGGREQEMNKSAVAAVALVGASALTGSAVLPGSATSAAPEMHTKRLVLQELGSREIGKSTFAGADKIRSAKTREVVGFDTYTARYYRSKDKVVLQVALALKGGVMVGRVSFGGRESRFDGRILKGSGKYSGVEGTISGRSTRDKTTVTLHYHL